MVEIFFLKTATSYKDRVTLREFHKSNFLKNLEELEKFNQDTEAFNFFSYDYFYVICCLFNDMDTDEDGLIGLNEYENFLKHNISTFVLRRVLVVLKDNPNLRVFEKTVCFEEFIRLMVFEEDKSSRNAIDFWFKVIDIDNDGVIG